MTSSGARWRAVLGLIAVAGLVLGCGKKKADTPATNAAATAAATPAAGATGQSSHEAGYTFEIVGAFASKSFGSDAGFCTVVVVGAKSPTTVFALNLDGASYPMSFIGTSGLPGAGPHAIGADPAKGYTAAMTVMTKDTDSTTWQRYTSQTGSLTIITSTPDVVSGRYRFTAVPTRPKGNGATITVDGKFDAIKAKGCK